MARRRESVTASRGLSAARKLGLSRIALPRLLSWLGLGLLVLLWLRSGRGLKQWNDQGNPTVVASHPPAPRVAHAPRRVALRRASSLSAATLLVLLLTATPIEPLGEPGGATVPASVSTRGPSALASVEPAASLPTVATEPRSQSIPTPAATPTAGERSTWRADPAVAPLERSARADPPLPAPTASPAPRLPFLPRRVEVVESANFYAESLPGSAVLGTVQPGEVVDVLGAQRNRLQIAHELGRGWISLLVVEPIAEAARWAQPRGEEQLWISAKSQQVVAILPPSSVLRVLREDGGHGRAQVRAYDPDGQPLAEGWVALGSLTGAEPPAWAAKLMATAPRVNVSKLAGERQAFIERVGAAARSASERTGIPASVTVAQAILESSWGESRLAREANNYFGIKAHSSIGPAGVIWMPTIEIYSGQQVRIMDVFRAYHDLSESVLDKHEFLSSQPRYGPAMQVTGDPAEFVHRMWQAGYSTDPDYVNKVLSLINQYGLTRFDPR